MRAKPRSIGKVRCLILGIVVSLTSPSLAFGYEVASDYFSLGGSLFSPSGYNLVVKYNQRNFNYTISGMYFHPYFGTEGSLDFNLFNTTSFRNGPGIFAGYVQQKSSGTVSTIYNAFGENMPYAGLRYFWDFGLVNAAFGVGYGFEVKPFIFPVFNVGAKIDLIESKNVLWIEGSEPGLFRDRRDPVLTGLLSVFPGGGYYYLGDWGRGVLSTLIGLATQVNVMGMAYVHGSDSPWSIGSYAVYLGFQIFTTVDSVLISLKPEEKSMAGTMD